MSGDLAALYRAAYAVLNTSAGRSDEFKRGVVETVAFTLELTGSLGLAAVAERLGLDHAALYPPAAATGPGQAAAPG